MSEPRKRCDENSGISTPCGMPIRCNLDAEHDGPHDAQLARQACEVAAGSDSSPSADPNTSDVISGAQRGENA